jgi:hypothetical protein
MEKKMYKRALLIAFHFPPQAGSSGIQRSLSFSRHLPSNGWQPIVLTAHPRAYEVQNPSQLATVPANLQVRRAFALDAKRHMGFKGRYLGLVALPDRWVSWVIGAIPAGLSLIRSQRPRVIWSTFPIATAHLIGLVLHRLTGLPWIADFRDPMLQPSYPTHAMQRKFYRWIEYQTITHCQRAVFTTHSALDAYRRRFPEIAASKFSVIENGYDEDSFALAASDKPQPSAMSKPLTLLHSGVLYDTGRDPSPFFAAIARLKQQGFATPQTLRVVLRAPGAIDAVTQLIEKYQVSDIVSTAPPVPYRLALKEMLEADGLLVFQGTPFNTQVPAKVYEYFRAQRPIFGLVDPAGETARVLAAANFSDLAPIDSAADIAIALQKFVSAVRASTAHVADAALVESSSRANRAHQLSALFDEVA